MDQSLLILKLVLGCDCKLSVVCIQTRHTDLMPPQVCGRSWRGCRLCGFTYHHQLIGWHKVNNLKVLVTVWCFRRIVVFRVYQRDNKAHWVNILIFFQRNHLKVLVTVWCFKIVLGIRVCQRGTKVHWVNTLHFQVNHINVLVTVWFFRTVQDIIMSKDTDYPLFFIRNEDYEYLSLIYLHGKSNKDSGKQDIVTNIEFEAIVTSIKKNFFHEHMVDFSNKLYFNDNKYQTNGTIINYNATVFLLCCLCLCVPSFGTFPVLTVSRPIPIFTPKYMLFTPMYRATWDSTRGTARGTQGGIPVWLGGVCSLVRGVTQACSLT